MRSLGHIVKENRSINIVPLGIRIANDIVFLLDLPG
jgi:hypothetical protein